MQKTTIEMQAKGLDYQALNASLRALGAAQVAVHGVMGQRYLGCGMQDQCLKLYGTPGNGLGQYLSGGTIEVFGSAQEATGDTMNAGRSSCMAAAATPRATACAAGASSSAMRSATARAST